MHVGAADDGLPHPERSRGDWLRVGQLVANTWKQGGDMKIQGGQRKVRKDPSDSTGCGIFPVRCRHAP